MNDPVNFVDPSGLSQADVNRIQNQFNSSVSRMNSSGLRRPGSGLMNGLLNNLSISRDSLTGRKNSRFGCGGQSLEVKDDLIFNLGPTDDNWTFTVEENLSPIGIHMNVKGKSGNPNDPVLTIDPWYNSFTRSK